MADDTSLPFADKQATAVQADVRSRLDRYLSAGFQRLPAGPLGEAVTACAEPLLKRLALGLVTDDHGPLGAVRSPTRIVEEELAGVLGALRSLKGDRRAAVQVTDWLRLLLGTFSELCQKVGWFVRESAELRFAGPELPSLLVGQALVQQPSLRDKLRIGLGRHADWAEAAQVAVSLGDPIAPWVELLLGEHAPVVLRERLVVTCGALGGVAAGTPATEPLRRAFHLAVAGLIWFMPAWRDAGQRTGRHRGFREVPSAWYLTPSHFVDCILWLAHASQALQGELGLPSFPQLWLAAPPPLGPLIDTLGLPLRLSEAEIEARSIVALCAPAVGLSRGFFDEAFWQALFATNGRFWALRVPALEGGQAWNLLWIREYGAPTLLRGRMLTELVIPGPFAPAGALMNYAPLLPLWHRAWTELLASVKEERLADAWAQAARSSTSLSDGEARKLIYEDAPAQLRAAGLWPQAVAALRRHVNLSQLMGHLVSEPEGPAWIAREAALLRLCAFTAAEWTELIAAIDAETVLGWRTLLEAGAPPVAIAALLLKSLPQDLQMDATATWRGLYWLFGNGPPEALAALAPLGELSDQALDQLSTWTPGPWLDRLCGSGLPWPAAAQKRLLQRLACYSEHLEVRRRCTDTLLGRAWSAGDGT